MMYSMHSQLALYPDQTLQTKKVGWMSLNIDTGRLSVPITLQAVSISISCNWLYIPLLKHITRLITWRNDSHLKMSTLSPVLSI